MNYIFPIVCLLVSINQAYSLLGYSFGSCPSIPSNKDFDINAYKGDWYQAAGIPNEFTPPFLKCIKASYGTVYDSAGKVVPNQVTAYNFGYYVIGGVNFYNTSVRGFAFPLFPNAPNQLNVVFGVPELTEEIITTAQNSLDNNYNVVDTDYNNYSLVYSCYDSNYLGFIPVKKEYAFVITRQRNANNLTELVKKFDKFTDSSLLVPIDQTNC